MNKTRERYNEQIPVPFYMTLEDKRDEHGQSWELKCLEVAAYYVVAGPLGWNNADFPGSFCEYHKPKVRSM